MGFRWDEGVQGQGSSVSTEKRNLSPKPQPAANSSNSHPSHLRALPGLQRNRYCGLNLCQVCVELRNGVVNTMNTVLAYTVFTLALAGGLLFFPFYRQ